MLEHQIRQADGRVYEYGAQNNVTLDVIAKHLSKICRFAGAVRKFYSVAQHSLLVEELMFDDGGYSAELRLKALLHDAHEAFITDIPTPMQTYLEDKAGHPFIHDLKDTVDRDVFRSLGVALPTEFDKAAIKIYDVSAFCLEARSLIKNPPAYVYDDGVRVTIGEPMSPDAAERKFLNRAWALRREIETYGPMHGAAA